MASVEAALSKVAAYAADDRHGYELGWHSASAMGGGTDCSGLVRYYAALLAGVATDSFPDFSTRTERSVLTGRGWSATAFSLAKTRRGDVLLSEPRGHTVIYLGGSRILGAEGDWDGRRGDSGGREVCERDYYAYDYNWVLRPPAEPAGEAAPAEGESDRRRQTGEEMYCIIRPNGSDNLLYFDGCHLHDVPDPDCVRAVDLVYRATHGGEAIPVVDLGSESAPWASRLAQVLASGTPGDDLTPGLGMFEPRVPEE